MMKYLLMALVDVLIKMVLSRSIKKSLPKIFKHIDSVLPCVVEQKATPEQVRQVFKDSITYETGKIPAEAEVEALVRLFDPAKAQKVQLGFDIARSVKGLVQ